MKNEIQELQEIKGLFVIIIKALRESKSELFHGYEELRDAILALDEKNIVSRKILQGVYYNKSRDIKALQKRIDELDLKINGDPLKYLKHTISEYKAWIRRTKTGKGGIEYREQVVEALERIGVPKWVLDPQYMRDPKYVYDIAKKSLDPNSTQEDIKNILIEAGLNEEFYKVDEIAKQIFNGVKSKIKLTLSETQL